MSNDLTTERLKLVAQTAADTRAYLAAMGPEVRKALSSEWLRLVERGAAEQWVHGYVAVSRVDGATVGRCGFKGPPGDDGAVEIAYGVEPAREGQGYATEMARALARHAFGTGVPIVRAHTLPEPNASTRVLTKCGFRKVGEVVDPEDGLVWRWEQGNARTKASRQLVRAACLTGIGLAGLLLGRARYPEAQMPGPWAVVFWPLYWVGLVLLVLAALDWLALGWCRWRAVRAARHG